MTSPAEQPETSQPPSRRASPWMWVSFVLAIAIIALLVWGFNTKSDLDDANNHIAELQKQAETTKQTGDVVVDEFKAAYATLAEDLGAANANLDQSQQAVEDAQAQADQAEKDAQAAQEQASQAQNETEKAQAEAEQAQAEAKAAESKATIAADCAKTYIGALGLLFQGKDAEAQADEMKKELESIASSCQDALGG